MKKTEKKSSFLLNYHPFPFGARVNCGNECKRVKEERECEGDSYLTINTWWINK